MALIRADRVKESSTSTGTGAFTLAGADSTYRTFASVCAVADTVYYAIAHRTANEWEVGLGTYSATNTLTRTTVHASSNANAAVTFSAGTKDVLLALTKTQLETYASLAGTETLTNKTINASNNTVTNVSLTTGVTGTLPLANGGTGTTTAQLSINALAGAVTSGSYLRGNGTNVVMAAIQAADVPTLNQNTTGTAANVTGTVALDNGGTGQTSAALAINALLPSQSANTGNFLTTNGTAASWATITKSSVGLANVENTALSTWTGSANITTLGTVGTGTWNATAIATAKGGTNLSAIGTANQVLGVNSGATALEYKTITAGSGVTVTHGANSVTIAATGGVGTVTSVSGTGTVSGITLTGTVTSSGNLTLAGTLSVAASNFASQTANTVLAAPSSVAGTPSFRALVAADIPTLNQNTTGTASGSVSGTASYLAKFTGTNVVGNSLIYDSGTNVGIGTASPSDKLHVVGNVRAGNYTYGYLAMTGDLPGYANGVYPTLKSDLTIYFSADGKYSAYLGDSSKNVFGLLHPTAGTANVLLNPNGTSYFTGGSVAFGATTAAGGGQVYVVPTSNATKGLVVRGASGQSANLQEWQNSAGTALAYVNSAGDIWGAGGGIFTGAGNGTDGFGESGPNVGVNRWLSYNSGSIYFNIRKLYGSRVFPATNANGDYVEIAKISRQHLQPITLTIHASHGGASGAAGKVYVIAPDYFIGNWTAAPLSGGKSGDFDFDVELVSPDAYSLAVRVRRHSSSTLTTAALVFTIESHNYNRNGMFELFGTGNSASALSYNSDYMRIGPTVSAPPPVGGSGAGTSLSISAASAAGTGAGGSVILQAGAFATSGSNGKVIVLGLASNTANLQEWQNNAGSVLSAVRSNGAIQPASLADSAAANNSIYYSTTASKLVYKDAAGTVNNLY